MPCSTCDGDQQVCVICGDSKTSCVCDEEDIQEYIDEEEIDAEDFVQFKECEECEDE